MASTLIERLYDCTSAATVLADWCGVRYLELDVLSSEVSRDSRLRPKRQTYKRTAFLRTPAPSSRPVARVTATVALDLLPAKVGKEILRGRKLLGAILIKAGAQRKTVYAGSTSRRDEAGNPISIRVEATFYLGDEAVAMVTEDVYEWVAGLPGN